jgi:hypothetical protein
MRAASLLALSQLIKFAPVLKLVFMDFDVDFHDAFPPLA